MTRRICYVSGTRADFGLMRSTLELIRNHPALELGVAVTGMHLSAAHGHTVDEIEAAGLRVVARVEVDPGQADGAAMARNLGRMTTAFVDVFQLFAPDMVLLLGDRGEMLAAAIAAIHLNIPVVHIHGGERSGTVDEPVRHAISKLSHWHCVATDEARERLIRMGEQPQHVEVTGAPGLDGLQALAHIGRERLCADLKLDPARKIALFVFHPVLSEAAQAGAQSRALLDALLARGMQVVALKPNSDGGSALVLETLAQYAAHPDVRVMTHFPRDVFVSWMQAADLMVGNSSSGIIEAATFGIPVLNVGMRQNMRQRNANVVDAALDDGLAAMLDKALAMPRLDGRNCYGDGEAGPRIADLLARVPLDQALLSKCNAY